MSCLTRITYLLKPGDLVAIVDVKVDPIDHLKEGLADLKTSLVSASQESLILFQVPAAN